MKLLVSSLHIAPEGLDFLLVLHSRVYVAPSITFDKAPIASAALASAFLVRFA